MEVFIFGWWWRSHQSLAHKSLRIFSFCITPWKDEREPKNYAWEDRLTWFKSSSEYRTLDRIDCEPLEWIRVEHLPRIHHIAALPQSPRVTVKIERNTRKLLMDGLSSCRCSTTSHGDLKTTKKNASQMLNSSLSMQRDLEQDNGHSSDLDQSKSGTLWVKTVHKENGTE